MRQMMTIGLDREHNAFAWAVSWPCAMFIGLPFPVIDQDARKALEHAVNLFVKGESEQVTCPGTGDTGGYLKIISTSIVAGFGPDWIEIEHRVAMEKLQDHKARIVKHHKVLESN